jgi:filamentous hemagglutinin
MNRHLDNIGLADTPANNQLITEHLLRVGNKVTPDNRSWVPSVLKGPKGSLQVESTWKILEDQRAYLTTLKLMPIKP